jgi:hypothetical protein
MIPAAPPIPKLCAPHGAARHAAAAHRNSAVRTYFKMLLPFLSTLSAGEKGYNPAASILRMPFANR